MFGKKNKYLKQLADRQGQKRIEAVRALAESPGLDVLTALVNRYNCEYDASVRPVIMEGISRYGKNAMALIINFLTMYQNFEISKGMALLEGLGLLHDPDTLNAVIRMLYYPDYMARKRAADILGKIKNPLSVEPLCNILVYVETDPRDVVRVDNIVFMLEYACFALGEIGDVRAVEPLIKILESKCKSYRNGWRITNAALAALGKIRDDRVVTALLVAVERDPTQMQAACKILGENKEKRAVEPLLRYLNSENGSIRQEAITALGKINDARAVEPIVNLLNDDYSTTRITAYRALCQFRDARAASAVKEYKKRMSDSYFIQKLLPLLPYWRSETRDTSGQIRSIGEEVDEIGGLEMMKRIVNSVYRTNTLLGQYLSAGWDRVGRWVS
jgi:HEAT repeat protein